MAAEEAQTTLSFIGQHEGITAAFIGILIAVLVYLWNKLDSTKKENSDAIIAGLKEALTLQRSTLDSTLAKLNTTVEKLEKTVAELAAELFRDMKNLDRRLSKLEGEHEAIHLRNRRAEDHTGEHDEC